MSSDTILTGTLIIIVAAIIVCILTEHIITGRRLKRQEGPYQC